MIISTASVRDAYTGRDYGLIYSTEEQSVTLVWRRNVGPPPVSVPTARGAWDGNVISGLKAERDGGGLPVGLTIRRLEGMLRTAITVIEEDKELEGRKHDQDKFRWDLLPWAQAGHVAAVLTYGARKYEVDNWKKVPDARGRYYAAAMRHLTAWWGGEIRDPESGYPHLAHAVCSLLFLMWFDDKAKIEGVAS